MTVWLIFFIRTVARSFRVARQIVFTRLELKMTKYKRVIGIDVSSKKLDISDSLGKLLAVIDNTVDAVSSKLVKKIASESTLVVCESTGGYENLMIDLLHKLKWT